VAAFRGAVKRTGGLKIVATQTFQHPRSSTADRLKAQAEGRHYSTFSLYPPAELRASIATFLARLPGPAVSWVDEHLLVVVGGSRRTLTGQAVKGQALELSAGRVGEAPTRRPGGHAQITPFGRGTGGHAGDQVAAQIGGSGARSPRPCPSLRVMPSIAIARC
jgi:hypothetical protein